MLQQASDLERCFATTQATENGHEIWNVEYQESLQVRVFEDSIRRISEI
jgi:hypothetical protein